MFQLVSSHPDRWLVSVPLTAAVPPSDYETWFGFGRFIGEPCTGGMSGGIVPGALHTASFVLPPEVEDPGEVAVQLVKRASANQPYARFAITVAGEPFVERMSRGSVPELP